MLKHRYFKQTKTPDPGRVSLVGAWEADYWTHELGVSHGELMKIIGKVGSSLAAVRKELGLAATSMEIVKFK
jgi:predicted RNA-binding protein YlqC (UPF0109 family)